MMDESRLPPIPSERELSIKIKELQKKMGIPTEDEYDPLKPGANNELWPGGPGTEYFTNDIRNV
jgi:hypothetical protein